MPEHALGSTALGRVRPSSGSALGTLRHLDPFMLAGVLALGSIGLWVLKGTVVGTPALEAAAERQAVWFVVGLAAMVATLLLDSDWVRRLALPGYCLNLMVLVAVLFKGSTIKGAKSWFAFGPVSFQPGEPMKIFAAMLLANWLAARPDGLRSLRDVAGAAAICGIPAGLILLQPDLGTASLFAILFACGLLWGGASRRTIIGLAVLGLMAGSATFPFLKPYQKERILNFVHPDRDVRGTGYNVAQAKIAEGAGGVWGRGWGEGTQSVHRFLPEAHTDFIFASAVEQTGLAGAVGILGLYGLVGFRFLRAAGAARDRFGGYLAVFLGTIFFGHVFLNIGMEVGLLPVTGLPLPFLSYGGSYLASTCVLLGLVLSVGMRRFLLAR